MRRLALAALLLALAACSRNPVLGDWEVDASETGMGAMLAVKVTELEKISFTRDAFISGDTKIEGSYVVEEGRVRFVRADGNGEHVIETLPEGRIAFELPIGVRAVYKPVD